MDKELKKLSKFVSLLLRHNSEKGNLKVDQNGGWVDVEDLLEALKANGYIITIETVDKIVYENTKPRYSYSIDKQKIRANYGHSIPVILDHKPVEPPDILYHGTVKDYLESIKEYGILSQSRQLVHLSEDIETAKLVAMRRGKPIILKIKAKEMYHKGNVFYKAGDNIWLTEKVSAEYIIY